MTWSLLVLWMVLPALTFAVLLRLLPGDRSTPRRRAGRNRDRVRGHVAGALDRTADRLRRGHHRETAPDPFDALHVQIRLGIVAEHLRELEDDPHAWARAERIIASQLAYDALLADACRLAGVEVLPRAKGDPWERMREEVELAARGWTW
ncbi:hypothetical protein [Cellulomonas triticagri]|jgi:hypothetical protein|uniref:Uncharacterized protein n=1 Tax=Cellulomonas triticagri TaxID=2483352 RepID=A0A3M2J8G5_9CELL|nr:hypothetical protein [Cellulomonas triticagri]RMI09174.1 hypothetical protein EBM89_11550 [Cellulomonas triticagri]